ncbi:acetate--CoA ligase family protein (plasmid) [Polaromonas sp. P1-6]|nr:acetate--CoA ligase family protein [Polaromonas sp. P1-6]
MVTAEAVLADANTDLALMVLTTAPDVPGLTKQLADGAENERSGGKPTFYVMLPGRVAEPARRMLVERGLPYVDTLAEAVSVLRGWKDWSDYCEPEAAQRPTSRYTFTAPAPGTLGEAEAKALLAAAGLPVNRGVVVRSVDEAVTQSAEVGFPLVLKVVSPDIAHKSDVGGVALNIADTADLRARLTQMQARIAAEAPQARIDGFSLQAQEGGELELIVGARHDAQFGAQVIVGAGGVLVELFKDVAVCAGTGGRRQCPRRARSAQGRAAAARSGAVARSMRRRWSTPSFGSAGSRTTSRMRHPVRTSKSRSTR